MDKYFIGWSGNQALANELGALINTCPKMQAIVGGGAPKDMYIGAQVLNQIQQCNFAVLLVEDKDGFISPNLMFEWGYLMAKLPINSIYTFCINKKSRDLPSDLLGTWVFEITHDKDVDDNKSLAQKIFEIFKENIQNKGSTNYFDLINDWRQVFSRITNKEPLSDFDLCQSIIVGCFAAYYYMDYHVLRRQLDDIKGTEESADIIAFAKSYISVFLESDNMMHPLSEDTFFKLSQDFEMTLNRKRNNDAEIESLIDILCYDIYGLSCSLFLRNENLEKDVIEFCYEKALEFFKKDLELIDAFENANTNNKCLNLLIRAYIYNDLSNLYRNVFNDEENFLHYLGLAVNARKELYQSFNTFYNNPFLSVKLEQEYIIALSKQCVFMDNSFTKTMSQNAIKKKVKEWEKETLFTSSLTERIKENIKNF